MTGELVGDFPLLLLAGGKSSRMGAPKGLLPVAGVPFFHWQLRRFHAAGGRRAVVVIGYDATDYLAAGVPPIGSDPEARLEVVMTLNPQPQWGPFSSIQAGWHVCREHAPGTPGAFILPVDVPAAAPSVWGALVQASRSAAIPLFEDRGGHPVLLRRAMLDALATCPAQDRLDHFLRRLAPEEVRRVEVQDGMVRSNLNSREDWDRVLPTLISWLPHD